MHDLKNIVCTFFDLITGNGDTLKVRKAEKELGCFPGCWPQEKQVDEPEAEKNEGVVSKETVVLRRWGSSIQKFGFINGVDNVNWPPHRDSKS